MTKPNLVDAGSPELLMIEGGASLIICLMTLKPDWPGALSIMAGALIVAVGVGLIYPKASREPQTGKQAEPVEGIRAEER